MSRTRRKSIYVLTTAALILGISIMTSAVTAFLTDHESFSNQFSIEHIDYPIGSIHIRTDDREPETLFGGEWELVSSGESITGVEENDSDFNTAQKSGGEKMVTLTAANLPAHKHTAAQTSQSSTTAVSAAHTHGNNVYIREDKAKHGGGSGISIIGALSNHDEFWWSIYSTGAHAHNISHTHGITVGSSGSGEAHNNMSPYTVFKVWKRVDL